MLPCLISCLVLGVIVHLQFKKNTMGTVVRYHRCASNRTAPETRLYAYVNVTLNVINKQIGQSTADILFSFVSSEAGGRHRLHSEYLEMNLEVMDQGQMHFFVWGTR